MHERGPEGPRPSSPPCGMPPGGHRKLCGRVLPPLSVVPGRTPLPAPRGHRRWGPWPTLLLAALLLSSFGAMGDLFHPGPTAAPGVADRTSTSPFPSPSLSASIFAPSPFSSHSPSTTGAGCPIQGLVQPAIRPTSALATLGAGGLSAHSVDPKAVPNSGFEFNVTGFAMPLAGSGSFLLTEQEVVADQILAMGLFANSTLTGSGTIPFWAVIDNTTGHFISCGYTFNLPPTVGQNVPFQALNTGGRTWEVLYKGLPFGGSNNITMNGTQSTWTGGVGVVTLANWNGTAWAPSLVQMPFTMRVLTASGWYLPHPVAATWNGTGPAAWGEAGTVQQGYLAPGALDLGTSVPVVTNGTLLWSSSAPTPLAVSVSTTSTSLVGGATTALSVRATAAGVPISGLSVVLSTSGGGSFSPALPWATSPQGYANGSYRAPLVSSPASVQLSANVGNGLFQGTGQTTVQVSPTIAVLTVTLSGTQVAPGALVNLTVSVKSGSQGIAGLNLTFVASVGGGGFSPAAPWVTDTNGVATGTYQAPQTSGPVEITFTLQSVGFSGSSTAWLNVTGGPSGSTSSGTNWGIVGVDVALALILLVLVALYARSRNPRPSGSSSRTPKGSAADEEEEPSEEEGPQAGGEGGSSFAPSSSQAVVRRGSEARRDPSTAQQCPGCGASLHDVEGRFCPKCGAPLSATGKIASQTNE